MTNSNTMNQVFGITFSVALVASMLGSANAAADTIFPPRHHNSDLVVVETSVASAITVQGSYYRPVMEQSTEANQGGEFQNSLADREIRPWYRAYN